MTTALDMTRAERRRYAKSFLRMRKPWSLTAEELERREELIRAARRAASVLKKRYNARRVILFGSLAHGAWFSSDTDIDIAVDGVDSECYWRAWAEAEAAASPTSVDLVDLQFCSENLRDAVRRKGIEL